MASRLLTIIAAIMIARILGKDGFGEYGIIQSTVAMFAVFAGFGMGTTSTKYVAELRQRDPEKASRIIALSHAVAGASGIVMTTVVLVAAPWLAAHTLSAPQLTGAIRIGSLLLLLTGINGAQTGALAGFESFKKVAQVNLVSGGSTLPLAVAGAALHGLEGAVWGLVISTAMSCLFGYFVLRAEAANAGVDLRVDGWHKEWRVVLGFSFPLLAANLMVAPVNWVCAAMLFNLPGGDAEMGAFTAANQWFAALLVIPNLLGQSVLPMLAERLGADDNRRSLKLLKFSIALNSVAVLPIVVLGAASPVIMACYGREFRGDWATLCVMLLTAGVLAVQVPVGQIIIASGRIWPGLLMNVGWAFAYLLFAWLLIGRGAVGVATGRLAAYLVHAVWTFWFAASILRKHGFRSRHA